MKLAVMMATLVGTGAVWASVTISGNTITFDVGENVTETYDEAIATDGSITQVIKKGLGTMRLTKEGGKSRTMTVRVQEGVLELVERGALASYNNIYISKDAQFYQHSAYASGEGYATICHYIKGVAGNGPDGKGAIFHQYYDIPNKKYLQQNCLLKSGGSLILSADATVGGIYNLGFGGGALYLEGHTLSIRMNTTSQPLDLSFESIATAGDIDVVKGRLFLDDATTSFAGSSANTVRIAEGNQLAFRGTTVPIPYSLILDGKVTLYPSQGSGLSDGQNEWAGPVTLNGKATVNYTSKLTGVHISGPVSGTGSFAVDSLNSLRLSNPGNTFSGGVDVSNDAFDSDGTPCGLYVDAEGALPLNGTIITNHTGSIVFRGGNMTVPDIMVASGGLITNSQPDTIVRVGRIEKWGKNELILGGGISVTNELYDGKGTVRLSGYETEANEKGLKYGIMSFKDDSALTSYFKAAGISVATDMKLSVMWSIFKHVRDNAEGVKTVSAIDSAYASWNADEKFSMRSYWGYYRNDEPTNVVVTFATSIADTAALWIDGQGVVYNVNSKRPAGVTTTYFITLGETVLTPGIHKFELLLGHFKTSSSGPRPANIPDSGVTWPDKFGLAYRYGRIDPSAPTNATGYAAIENTDSRIVLTTEAGAVVEDYQMRPEYFRPTVAKLSFVKPDEELGRCRLELVQSADEPAYEVGTLKGVGILGCGALTVTDGWMIDKASHMYQGPFVVSSGATLTFAAAATFEASDFAALEGQTLMTVEEGGVLTGCPKPASRAWRVRRVASDLLLFGAPGSLLMIR